MSIYIIYFIFIAVVAVEYDFSHFKRWPVLVLLLFMLALIAGLRGPGVSRDYDNYLYIFNAAYSYFEMIKNGSLFNFIEPGFVMIAVAIRGLSEVNYAILSFLFFAFSSLWLKVFAIEKLSINPYLAILFYFSHYFTLLEMTQIRSGLASALFFIAILYYLKGNRLIFSLLIMLAITFHYSAVLYFLVLVFNTKNLNRYLYSAVLVVSVTLGLLKLPLFNIIGQVNPDIIVGKLKGYENISAHSNDLAINTFNVIYIANVLCISYLLFFVPKAILQRNPPLIFFTKCNILSVFFLSLLSGTPIIAFRVSELFGVASIIMFAGVTPYLPFKRLNIILPVFLAGLFFYINFFHNQVLNAYHMAHFR